MIHAMTSAFKYWPESDVYGKNEQAIANKRARSVNRRYTARPVGDHTYTIVDESGHDIPDTVFTVTIIP